MLRNSPHVDFLIRRGRIRAITPGDAVYRSLAIRK
jgi:hypothetical protein